MRTKRADSLVERVEEIGAVEPVADRLQSAVARVVPLDSEVKDALSGTWLGHPVHPPLTDVVIGAFTSSVVLDLVGGRGTRDAADRLIGIGLLAAVPTAAAGLSDWAELSGETRRVGVVHALGNVTATALFGASLAARRRGRRGRGIGLSLAGMAVATGSAFLGGHLSFRRGVGVDQTVFAPRPDDWTAVLDASELRDGEPVAGDAGGTGVMLVRRGETVHAIADRCTHRGCSLSSGELAGDAIVCPCHGSTFSIADGSVLKGPAIAPQQRFEARVRDGRVEVRAAGG